MDNLQKLMEKPIVIEKAKDSSSEMYEEKDSIDYIEESKTLKRLNHG